MERCAANQSFKASAVAILLLGFSACAPAFQEKAQLSFSVQKYGVRAAGLSYNSSTLELSPDLCYAIHVTSFDNNPTLQRMAPSASDATCEHGPRGLGLLTGTFAKGSIAEIEVPIGPRRRFDLVALEKSKMPGGVCGPGLRAEVTGPAGANHNVQLYIGSTLLDDEGMRLIARGEVDINPGLVNVVMEAVAVDPKGLEYGCHNGSGGGGGSSSATPTTGPGSLSEPLVRSGNYLSVYVGGMGPAPNATIPFYVNAINKSNFPVEGSCSAVGTNVSVTIGSVSAEFPCVLNTSPFLNSYDNRYYNEGRWGGTMDLSALADSGDAILIDVRETLSDSTIFTAYDYTLLDTHAFLPTLFKDTSPPSLYIYTPMTYGGPSRIKFYGSCTQGLPVYVKNCSITESGNPACPPPNAGEAMASVPCSGGSYELFIYGTTFGGNITFQQKDEAGNITEVTRGTY